MNHFASLRQGAGFAIADVAAEFSVDVETVENWENGLLNPPTRVVQSLDLLKKLSANPLPPLIAPPIETEVSAKRSARSGTFTDNMKLPVHRWFRYSAGFSAEWVESVIKKRAADSGTRLVLDPFAGSGTTLIAAQNLGVPSIGLESHPFVCNIAKAKINADIDTQALRSLAASLLEKSMVQNSSTDSASPLLAKCYTPDVLSKLFAIRSQIEKCDQSDQVVLLLRLALTAILRECSHAGTAQWQYVLPNKSKSKVTDPSAAFINRVNMFASDIELGSPSRRTTKADLIEADARNPFPTALKSQKADLVLTSPPYPNNYDYADATRLEMTFWGEIAGWGELQGAVRHRLVRSCSQHSAAEKLSLDDILSDPLVGPIRDELSVVCKQLGEVRLERGGKKTYHTMVAAYFRDLAAVWQNLRECTAVDADVCFVIGDSAPYGVYVPVDLWLTKLATSAGFHNPRFDKLRDRNIKWKNRKHRVPLKEGNLWLKG